MPKLSGNKGEWSEIYVFLRLLEVGKLYAADADLNKMDDVFYNIINIVRTEDIGVRERHTPHGEGTRSFPCRSGGIALRPWHRYNSQGFPIGCRKASQESLVLLLGSCEEIPSRFPENYGQISNTLHSPKASRQTPV